MDLRTQHKAQKVFPVKYINTENVVSKPEKVFFRVNTDKVSTSAYSKYTNSERSIAESENFNRYIRNEIDYIQWLMVKYPKGVKTTLESQIVELKSLIDTFCKSADLYTSLKSKTVSSVDENVAQFEKSTRGWLW
jgi:hypothetical protein